MDRRPPAWFVVLAVVALGFVCAAGDPREFAPGPDGLPARPLGAFWPAVMLVVGWIWTGIQVAGRITLQILAWSVKILWAFATRIQGALVAVGRTLLDIGRKAWDFLRLTYERVLRPAWMKFWNWFDKLRRWLDRTVGPVLRFLDSVRTHILKFYDKWVRPILDTIGIARRVLGILSSLGLEWARALDRKLRWLEEKIDLPFRIALGKINEVIGVINRVVTADGLFQRLAYIRTLQRDIDYTLRIAFNRQSRDVTPDERDAFLRADPIKSRELLLRESRTYLTTGQGPHAASISEWSQILVSRLGGP